MHCPVCEAESELVSNSKRNVLFCNSCNRIFTLDRSTTVTKILEFVLCLTEEGFIDDKLKAINVIPLGM